MNEYGRSGRKCRRESRKKTEYKSQATERPGRRSTEVDGAMI